MTPEEFAMHVADGQEGWRTEVQELTMTIEPVDRFGRVCEAWIVRFEDLAHF